MAAIFPLDTGIRQSDRVFLSDGDAICCYIIAAWVIGITAAGNALFTAIVIVLMVIAMIASNGMWAGKSNYAITVECCFIGVMSVVMIICQGIL